MKCTSANLHLCTTHPERDNEVVHPDDHESPQGQLRERKRIETRQRLADAALDLVLREGLDAVTVEQISDRAGVSRRTFFNYFDSKDDALLVTSGFELTEEMLAQHAVRYADAPVIECVVGLLFTVSSHVIRDSAGSRQRGMIITRYPQLVEKQKAFMARGAAEIMAALDRILEAHPDGQGFSTTDGSTQTLLGLCHGALQFTTAAAIAGEPVDDLETLERQCVDLVRSTIARLR